MNYFIYILTCSNGAYYTGYTTDIKRRYQEHQQGSSKCKFTRSFPPKELSACWQIQCDLSSILKIERIIKKLSKLEKKQLVDNQSMLTDLVSKAFPLGSRLTIDVYTSIT